MSAVTPHFEAFEESRRGKLAKRMTAFRIAADWIEQNMDALQRANVDDLGFALLGDTGEDRFSIYCYSFPQRDSTAWDAADRIKREVGGDWISTEREIDRVEGFKLNIIDEADPFWIILHISKH